VIIAHLHFLGGISHNAVLLVKLGPLGQPQLAGPHHVKAISLSA